MYTQCPHCLSVHALDAGQLALGRGQLLCGVCEREFDGLERLADSPAQAAVGYGRGRASAPPKVLPEGMSTAVGGKPTGSAAPAFAQGSSRRRSLPSGRWWAAAAVLALALAAQAVLAQRAELAQDPAYRPWLQRLCATVGCDLPQYSAPEQMVLLSRDVSPHPSVADALLITASFRNEAPWAQAWPALEISMSDLDGRLVALRRFRPPEYLGQAPERDSLAPGESAVVELEVRDPGNQAIAFEFTFL